MIIARTISLESLYLRFCSSW